MIGQVVFSAPTPEEQRMVHQMREAGASEEDILTVMHNYELQKKKGKPIVTGPGRRRRSGNVSFDLGNQQFICQCWLPGETWCFHLEEFFRTKKDIAMVRKIEPGDMQVYKLPWNDGMLLVETRVMVLPTEKGEVVMADSNMLENQTVIADGENLLNGLAVLMNYYLSSVEAENAKYATFDRKSKMCGGKRHARMEQPAPTDEALAAQAYTLTHYGICVMCYTSRAYSFQEDVPEI